MTLAQVETGSTAASVMQPASLGLGVNLARFGLLAHVVRTVGEGRSVEKTAGS